MRCTVGSEVTDVSEKPGVHAVHKEKWLSWNGWPWIATIAVHSAVNHLKGTVQLTIANFSHNPVSGYTDFTDIPCVCVPTYRIFVHISPARRLCTLGKLFTRHDEFKLNIVHLKCNYHTNTTSLEHFEPIIFTTVLLHVSAETRSHHQGAT
jgi:hypothetical protein